MQFNGNESVCYTPLVKAGEPIIFKVGNGAPFSKELGSGTERILCLFIISWILADS
jgi:hypothetical protein